MRRSAGWPAAVVLLVLASACSSPAPGTGPVLPRQDPLGSASLQDTAALMVTSAAPASASAPAMARLAHDPDLQAWAEPLVAEWQDAGFDITAVGPDPTAPLLLTAGERASPPPPGALRAVAGWRYVVLAQPWLDPPLALDTAAARRAARGEGAPSVTPLTRLDRLHWGLVPVPVDGVAPDPVAIMRGSYPLATPLHLVLQPGAPAAARAAFDAATGPGAAARRSGLGDGGPAVTIAAVGDIMLDRGVANQMRAHGWTYPVAQVAEQLAAASIAVANLESPLGTGGTPILSKGIWFRAPPEVVIPLQQAGIDVVSLANNHTMDYGPDLLLETLSHLEQAGIGFVGGGEDLAAARRPLILERGGLRVAFLGYNAFAPLTWNAAQPQPLLAGPARPGTVPPDPALMAADIAAARSAADVVVVSVHWGEEYQNRPTPEQVALGRQMADLGADIILGSHPHAIQGFERRGGALIAWSLGNFIMDQDSLGEVTRESMLLELTLYPGGGRSVRLYPMYITGFRPAPAEPERAEALRAKLRHLSGWGFSTETPIPPADR